MRFFQILAPQRAPLALAEIRAFLRLDHEDDDALLASLLEAAVEACESFTGRALISQGWRLLAPWPLDRRLRLGHGPVQTVDAVRRKSMDGTSSDIAANSYWLDQSQDPALLHIVGGDGTLAWPGGGQIEVDFRSGYGDDWNAVPMSLRQGLLRLIAHQYQVRDSHDGGAMPSAVAALWAPFRTPRL
ncbi:MAG: hypothetical protein Tsb0016_25100 [Sphingomonadales bacterium]